MKMPLITLTIINDLLYLSGRWTINLIIGEPMRRPEKELAAGVDCKIGTDYETELLTLGIPDNSEHFSTRLIYSVVLLVNFLVGVYYNTSILNGLLLPAPNAIQNSDQLLKSDIHLGLQDITYIKEEMTHNDSLTIRMREKLDKSEKPHYLSTADGVANLRKGQYAFYAEGLAVYHEMERTMSDAQKCSLTEVEKYKPFHIAYVARKNSPYKEHLNRALQRIRERGVLKRMKNYWLHKKPACHWKQDALSLGAEPLFLAYMCMLLGIIASATLFLLEKSFPPRFASKPEVETGTFWP